jgi:hypothetical protein
LGLAENLCSTRIYKADKANFFPPESGFSNDKFSTYFLTVNSGTEFASSSLDTSIMAGMKPGRTRRTDAMIETKEQTMKP